MDFRSLVANQQLMAIAAATVLAFSSFAASASSQTLQCDFEQITDTSQGFSFLPDIDDSGTRITFAAVTDVSGGPPYLPDIFLAKTDVPSLAAITSASGGTTYHNPVISGDGNYIGYEQVDSTIKNIFLYDDITPATVQLTDTPLVSYANELFKLNSDGTRGVLRSKANLEGDNSAIVGFQLFLWDATDGFTQITDVGGGGVNDTAIDGAGTVLAFSSAADLDSASDNSDGNREVFLYQTDTGAFTQVTDTVAPYDNSQISLSGDGLLVAFVSTADLLTGQNSDHSREIFLFDNTTGTLLQITDDPEINSIPDLSADGSKLVFYTEFSDYYQIFVYDVASGSLDAMTPPSVGFYSYEPAVNADGTAIVFVSDDDLLGSNADGNEEIFLARNCSSAAADDDNDGIPDDVDACLNSDIGPTVEIEACDTGIVNSLFEDGCSLADLAQGLVSDCASGASNHGRFVSCFTSAVRALPSEILARSGRGSLRSCASRADIP